MPFAPINSGFNLPDIGSYAWEQVVAGLHGTQGDTPQPTTPPPQLQLTPGELPPTIAPNYPNVFVAGQAPQEQALLQEVMNIIGGGMLPQTSSYSDYLGGGYMDEPGTQNWMDALTGALSGTPTTEISPETSESFWQESILAPAMRTWEQDIMPQLAEQFAARGGNRSSAAINAMARSGEDLMTNLARQRGQLMYQDEQARRQLAESGAQRALEAIGPGMQWAQGLLGAQGQLAESAEQRRMGALPLYSQLAAMPRQLQQQFLNAVIQEWQRQRPEQMPTVQDILNFLNNPQMALGTTQTPSPWEQSQLTNAYGGGGLGGYF